MSLNNQIIIASTAKAIDKSKSFGKLELDPVMLFYLNNYYLEFSSNNSIFDNVHKSLLQRGNDLKVKYRNELCTIKEVLPENISIIQGNTTLQPVIPPFAQDILVSTITKNTLFGSGDVFDMYSFRNTDFLNSYTSSNSSTPAAIAVDRATLKNGSLIYNTGITSGNIYGILNDEILIDYNILESYSLYVDKNSENFTKHSFKFRYLDIVNGEYLYSNYVTLTFDRTIGNTNQPPTVGDVTIVVDNRAITTLTLDMFTSQLIAPYNDPEGDLIDAIRIDEMSKANKGVFKLNGIEVLENQLITREDFIAGAFIHEGADITEVWGDNFSFSARDEVSQIWVN